MTRKRPALDRLASLTFTHRVPMSTLEEIIRSERRRYELAVHEAGHAVAGVVLGGQLLRAEITDQTGLTSFEPDTFPPGRTAAIAYAGPWSELRGIHRRPPTLRELYAVLCSSRDQDALCAAGGTVAGRDVVPLLSRCWDAIDTLAGKLNRTSCVTHRDVCDALGLSRDSASRAVELAMIRSGSRPGTFTVSTP